MKKNFNRKFNKKMRLFNSLEEPSSTSSEPSSTSSEPSSTSSEPSSTPQPINCKEARENYNETCKQRNRLKSELNNKKIGLIIDKKNYKKNHPNCNNEEYKNRLQQVVDQKKIIINSDRILESNATKEEKKQAKTKKSAANSVINKIPGGRKQLYTTASFKIAFDKQKSRIDKLEEQLTAIKDSMQNRNPKCENIPPDCTTPNPIPMPKLK